MTSATRDVTTYVLMYKLAPERMCRNFRYESPTFSSTSFKADFRYSIWQDMLTVWYQCDKTEGQYDIVSRRAELLVKIFLAGYAFFSLKPIDHILANWFEYEGIPKKLVVGKAGAESYPEEGHPDNKPLARSEDILPLVSEHASLRRALDDFRSCMGEVSPDLYVFAFRSLEDIRSHFETSANKDVRKRAWNLMNKELGYRKEEYHDLVRLSEKYRHTNALEEPVDPTIAGKQIEFARGVIDRFVRYLKAKSK